MGVKRIKLAERWARAWELDGSGDSKQQFYLDALIDQAGYVSDLQRQMKARIDAGDLPDPLLLTTIGCMAKALKMTGD
jgi:hypothetical protein